MTCTRQHIAQHAQPGTMCAATPAAAAAAGAPASPLARAALPELVPAKAADARLDAARAWRGAAGRVTPAACAGVNVWSVGPHSKAPAAAAAVCQATAMGEAPHHHQRHQGGHTQHSPRAVKYMDAQNTLRVASMGRCPPPCWSGRMAGMRLVIVMPSMPWG
jgi:hypothetical protein